MELLIKGARVVDWSSDFIGDVYIKDGLIYEIGSDLVKNCSTIDARGKLLMPSFVDLHTHFRDPGFTHKEDMLSGSKAAVKGGYTAVNLMANTNPVCSTKETIEYVLNKSREVALVDVHQVASITKGFDGSTLTSFDELGNEVRMISEDGKDVLNSKVMMNAMIRAKENNFTVLCHSEDETLASTDSRMAENLMTWRNITLSKYTGCKMHLCHVSTKEAIDYIKEAKDKGTKLTCEVTPHHIALWDSDYSVNPPIRTKEDVNYIVSAIREGYVDAIATDHAPHTIEDKLKGSPGISGIETSFSVCYTRLVKEEGLSLNKLSEVMSKNPSKIMGINKGEIEIGKDGDLVLIDIDKKVEIDSSKFESKGKNTPFEGIRVYGEILKTIRYGEIVYEKENLEC